MIRAFQLQLEGSNHLLSLIQARGRDAEGEEAGKSFGL